MMLVTHDADPEPCVGLVVDDQLFDLTELAPYTGVSVAADRHLTMLDLIDEWQVWEGAVRQATSHLANGSIRGRPLSGVTLLAPIPRPRRNPFLVAGNYMDHVVAGERASGVPLTQRKTAIFFTKPTGAVSGPHDDIAVDTGLTSKLDYENELVVVIGSAGRNIPRATAMNHVLGYMVGNDVSARDIQRQKPTTDFLRGKGHDTFFPTGPGIVPVGTVPDYRALSLRTYVNGELRQEAQLNSMIRDVPELIAELSQGISLEPGDLIATGTPSGVQSEKEDPVWLADGDVVTCEIDEIGRLTNRVRAIP